MGSASAEEVRDLSRRAARLLGDAWGLIAEHDGAVAEVRSSSRTAPRTVGHRGARRHAGVPALGRHGRTPEIRGTAGGQLHHGARRVGGDARARDLIQTATTRPVKLGQPFTRWSIRKLLAYLHRLPGRTIGIGREALRLLLARHGITFQRTKTWKESPDPDVEAKLDRIEYALTQRPERTFPFDEFGPLGIRPVAGAGWAKQSRPDRLPATYRRTHGVTYFHGCCSVGDDLLWGVNRSRKGIDHTWAARRSIRAARPDGAPIYVILDNLSVHKNWRIRAWASKHKVELLFTPTYASWANPIEAHFGPLRQFTLSNSNHPNHTVQTRELQAYLRWRNAHARHPDVLAAQRRERARVRSEKGIRWGGRPLTPAA
ncbi:IS630 family transposase [Nonomuraea sp. NPDC003727]